MLTRLFMLTLLLLTCIITEVDASVRLTEDVKRYPLGNHASILEDKEGTLSIDQVSSKAYSGQWEKSTQKIINFAFSPSVFWIRISLESGMRDPKTFWLEGAGALQDYIDYYQIHDGDIIHEVRTGDRLPFQSRQVNYRNFVFPFHIEPHETHQIYLRLGTHDGFHEPLPILLWDRQEFTWAISIRNLGLGLYFGTMIAMGIYNLFIFLSVRDRAYAYYVIYTIGVIVWLATYFGITFQFLWPDSPNWGNLMIILSTGFWSVFVTLFIQSLLDTKKLIPWFDKLCRIAICCLLFTMFTGLTGRYTIGIKLYVMIGIPMCISTIVAGLICFRKGFKPARYFLLAWTTLLLSFIVFALKIAGILPAILIVEKSVQIGSVIEVILLSLSLADRINELKKEKILAQTQALQAVESSLKLKNDFISSISHELRTPMNAIIGGLEVVKKSPLDHLKSPLNIIQSGAADMMNLINDILIHTEIQSERLNIQSDRVDLHSGLADLYETYLHLCRDRQLSLQWHTSENLPRWILTDKEKCFIILGKLLDNAIKFTKAGGINVSIDYNESELLLTISDTGVGIPTDKQHSIFDSFTQSEGGFQRPYGGLGIGLTICKNLVEALGGEISFSSRINLGTTFTVSLPVEKAEAPFDRGSKQFSEKGPILIVEDNPVNQTVMKKLLEKIGCATLTASHGLEALDILKKDPVSLILMDLQMPLMDGFTCTEKIRTHDANHIRNIPIIAVTANLMDADKKRCLDCGMNDYLKKPISLESLKHILSPFLDL